MSYIKYEMLGNSFCDWYMQDCPDIQNVFYGQEPYSIGHVNLLILYLYWLILHVITIYSMLWQTAQTISLVVPEKLLKQAHRHQEQIPLSSILVPNDTHRSWNGRFLQYKLKITWQGKAKRQEHKTLIADFVHL